MFNLQSVMTMITNIPLAIHKIEEVKEVIEGVIATFKEDDQVVLKSALEQAIADNDLGFRNLDERFKNED
jgi:hypothetical protein